MKIRERELDIDVLEELDEFEWKHRKPIEGSEFQACSPFRDERRPSFYVNLETGLFMDHGATDETLKRGNLVKLLSFLRNESYEEIEDYLLEKYTTVLTEYEGLELNINLQLEETAAPKYLTREQLKPYLFRNTSYLLSRGISEEVQKQFIIGYDKKQNNIAFFWLDAYTGKVATVKFRSTKGKHFYYIKGGQPVRNLVFGLYQVIQGNHKKAYIVESEIDALYLWTHGIPAVALGGSNLSEKQRKLLLLSGVETWVIATDADKQGNKIRKQLKDTLTGYTELLEVELPGYAKDINDVRPEDIEKVTDSEKSVTLEVNLDMY